MYKRVLLKLSGESIKGDSNLIIDSEFVSKIVDMIIKLKKKGIEMGIVIGAGNIFRGKIAEDVGIERVPADFMGMMGTVMNAIAVSSALKKKGVESVVFSALPAIKEITLDYEENAAKSALNEGKVVFLAGGTGKPYYSTDTAATMRAIELNCDAILMGKNGVIGVYDDDPRINPKAKFIKDITYDEILEKKLAVMDLSAVELIKDKDIDIRVFSMTDLDNFERVVMGEDIGTTCHRKGK